MRGSLRWIVPAAVAAVIGSGVVVNSAVADSPPSVPKRTPEAVLALVIGSDVSTISGTITTHSDLGLPDLTSLQRLGGSAGSGPGARLRNSATDLQGLLTRFLTGDNTLRVWADGPTKARAQVLDPMQEIDLVRNGSQVWTYSSKENVAAQGTLPEAAPGTDPQSKGQDSKGLDKSRHQGLGGLPAEQLTPQSLAHRALAALDPTTTVALGTPATVAGRATYSLEITPRTGATLVERIVINVDAANGVPLRTGIYARGQADAALLSGFTAVDYAKPKASIFAFTAPKGARIETLPSVADLLASRGPAASLPSPSTGRSDHKAAAEAARPSVHGSGWATIVEARTPGSAASLLSDSGPGSLGAALQQLTTAVTGGRAVKTALFSVLLTDDGRVLAGAVPVQALLDQARTAG